MFQNSRRTILQLPFLNRFFALKAPVQNQAVVATQAGQTPDKPSPERVRLELWRGPYLQCQGSGQIKIRWRTNRTDKPGIIRFGDSVENMNRQVAATPVPSQLHDGMDWTAHLTNLKPGTRYYYAVEHSKAVLAGFDDAFHFTTARKIGEPATARFLLLGDCGTNRIDTGNPQKERLARYGFLKYNRNKPEPDGIILLGDNAYSHGTDAQYQTGFFDVYQPELNSLALWPCIGNHEISDDYLEIFTVPGDGEIGGTPSHSRNYYSWDFANIHFTVLDLWKSDWRKPDDTQIQWLKRDLAETKQHWKVVINHFPPYCDGKYESDNNGFLVEVRNIILPILEEQGTDIFITGHDHTYQRSHLIDGHYGPRTTFMPEKHLKSTADGVSQPIVKTAGPHSGIVHVVTGTAGGEQPPDPSNPKSPHLAHPVMVKLAKGEEAGRGIRKIGTFLLEIEGETLTGTQIDQHGAVLDQFTMIKHA